MNLVFFVIVARLRGKNDSMKTTVCMIETKHYESVFRILGLILLQQESECTIHVTLGSTIFIDPLHNGFGIMNEFQSWIF